MHREQRIMKKYYNKKKIQINKTNFKKTKTKTRKNKIINDSFNKL